MHYLLTFFKKNVLAVWQLAFSHKFFSAVILANVVLTYLPDNFKLGLLVYAIILLVFYLLTKNIAFSIFVVLLLSIQFITPGKYYSYQIISAEEYFHDPDNFPFGVVGGYGITMTNVFSVLMAFVLFKKLVNFIFSGNFHTKIFGQNKALVFVLKIFTLSWWLYFCVSLYSSFNSSFNLAASLVYLFHYMQVFSFFLLSVYFFLNKKTKDYFFQVLLGILVFQLTLGLIVFLLNIFSKSAADRFIPSYRLPEEEYLLNHRVKGTFLHANQYALIVLQLFLVTFKNNLLKFKKNFFYFCTFFLLIMTFAQSRIIWIILLCIAMAVLLKNRKKTILFLKKILKNNFIKLMLLFFFLISSAVIYPRISLSKHFLTESGGGGLRYKMLVEGLVVFNESPFFGHGVLNIVEKMWQKFPDGYVLFFPVEVHIGYLQMLLESGIFGMLFFSFPFGFIFLRAMKMVIKRDSSLSDLMPFLITSSIFVYYLIQPYAGSIEFSYLGIGLAFCVVSLYKKTNEIKKN